MQVRCDQLGGAWPDNSFTVTLMATGGADGCTTTSSAPATVTTHVKPAITVAPQPTTPVCSDTTSTMVLFDLSGLTAGYVYSFSPSTNDTVDCRGSAQVTAGALVRGVKHDQLWLGGKGRASGVHKHGWVLGGLVAECTTSAVA